MVMWLASLENRSPWKRKQEIWTWHRQKSDKFRTKNENINETPLEPVVDVREWKTKIFTGLVLTKKLPVRRISTMIIRSLPEALAVNQLDTMKTALLLNRSRNMRFSERFQENFELNFKFCNHDPQKHFLRPEPDLLVPANAETWQMIPAGITPGRANWPGPISPCPQPFAWFGTSDSPAITRDGWLCARWRPAHRLSSLDYLFDTRAKA